MKTSFKTLVAALVVTLGSTGHNLRAAVLSNGSSSVNIDSNGQLNGIILNGVPIDTSSFLQQYLVNRSPFQNGSNVAVSGLTATYSAQTSNGINIAVTSSVLGPVSSNPTTTNVLEQVLVFTNNTQNALPLSVLSDIDQDLNNTGGGDVVAFDSATQAVFARESPELLGAIAKTDFAGAVFGWDVGDLGSESRSFPTANRVGPSAPGDTAQSIGFDLGTLAPGASATVTFRYLAAIGNLSGVPSDFRFGPLVTQQPGGVDPRFNPGSSADAEVRAIVVQPDGRSLIGGSFNTYRGLARSGIARVNIDGTLDSSFDPGTGTDQSVNAILLQTDGKIVIGGDFTTFNGTPRNGLARLNANGSLDPSFDAPLTDGPSASANSATDYYRPMPRSARGTRAASTRSGFVTSLSAGPNGSVVAGGSFSTSGSGGLIQALTRLAGANGQTDPTFTGNATPNGRVRATITQPDGKSVIGGEFNAVGGQVRNGIARLNADGSLDTGFNPGAGTQAAEANAGFTRDAGATGGAVNALALALNGAIVLGGDFTSVGGTPRARIARVQSSGNLDTDFNPGSGADGTVTSLIVDSDTNKVLVGGGFTRIADGNRSAIARLNPGGNLDASFDPGNGANALVQALARLADGSTLVGGDFTQIGATPRTRLAAVGTGEPAFFKGAVALPANFFYLQFPNGTPFGYYSLNFYPYLFHNDLGFEYVFDANDGLSGVYLYDFASSSFFYTSPSFPFPYLYDFSLNAVLYYYPDAGSPGAYTKNPRFFFNFRTSQIITK